MLFRGTCSGPRGASPQPPKNREADAQATDQMFNFLLKGGESSSQFRWFTIAKIEL